MNIAIASSKKFQRYAYVMLKSLFDNNRKETIDVFVFYSELTNEDFNVFEELAKRYNNRIHKLYVDPEYYVNKYKHKEPWSDESYYKLMVLNLLPANIERLLYLDCDTLILKDIMDFYYTDFEDKYFVVCPDVCFGGDIMRDEQEIAFLNEFDKNYVYFNSGVMLWNIKELRGKYDYKDYMEVAKRFSLSSIDQDVFNYLYRNKVKYADGKKYNCLIRYEFGFDNYEVIKNNASIIHYLGPKPWNNDGFHFDGEKKWWEYAKMTPFYDEFCHEFVESAMEGKNYKMYLKLQKHDEMINNELNESIKMINTMLKIK